MSTTKYTGPFVPGMLFLLPPLGTMSAMTARMVETPFGTPTGYSHRCGLTSLSGGVPNWTDAATVGALAGVVRELYEDPRAYAIPSGSGVEWFVYVHGTITRQFDGPTEALAWLAAYHAHPSVASPASPSVQGDATDLDAAGVSAADVAGMRK